MKLLYFSCHAILEYDEVKLFNELGYDVFSAGAYSNPAGHESLPRPAIAGLKHYPDLERAASTIRATGGTFPDELINWADTIMFMHEPDILYKNWQKLKGKRVIFRSIGQSVPHQEKLLAKMVKDGLEIVRYSPLESTIENYAGSNALIRFYKDEQEYSDWNGSNKEIINFTQSLKQRSEFCGYDELKIMMGDLPHRFFGPGNEDLKNHNGGLLTSRGQMVALRQNRAYAYHGTFPASYTLSFIEAMMTGIPMAAVGPDHGNGSMFPNQRVYEIDSIIENGVNGFCSDDLIYLNRMLRNLLDDWVLAKRIGAAGRARAIELFGKQVIAPQWVKFLGETT